MLTSSGISCSKGSDGSLFLDVRAGVYTVTVSNDDSMVTVSACVSLNGYLRGDRPLQQLLYCIGKEVPGVRWVITHQCVILLVERLVNSTPEDDSLWVIGASCLLDQAIQEVDTLARLPQHSLWYFANIRSVAS